MALSSTLGATKHDAIQPAQLFSRQSLEEEFSEVLVQERLSKQIQRCFSTLRLVERGAPEKMTQDLPKDRRGEVCPISDARKRMTSLPEIERGYAAAQGSHGDALKQTFAKTRPEAEDKLESLVQANPQGHEYAANYDIHLAVRLREAAFELGHEMRAGLVMTERHWRSIVEENRL